MSNSNAIKNCLTLKMSTHDIHILAYFNERPFYEAFPEEIKRYDYNIPNIADSHSCKASQEVQAIVLVH